MLTVQSLIKHENFLCRKKGMDGQTHFGCMLASLYVLTTPCEIFIVFMNSRKRREARRSRTRSIYRLLLDRALSFPPCFVVLFSCVRIDYRTSRRERDRERDNARVPPCTRTLLPAKAAEPAGRPWRVSQVSLRGLPSIYFTVGAPIDQNLVEDPFIMSGWTTSGPAGR